MLDRAGDGTRFPRGADGGENIEVLGQRDIAGSHVKHSFPRRARQRFRFANDDRVLARGQVRDGDGKTFSVDFFAKCRLVIGGAFDLDRPVVLAMRKVPAQAHLLSATGAVFLIRRGVQREKRQISQSYQGNGGNQC